LALYFPAPATQSEYRTKPSHFLSHLVGHEGPGSLLSVLKGLGWATELSAGPGTTLPTESLFCVTIRLTEEGVPAWEGVVDLVFHYFHLVRASEAADRQRLWWEAKTISHLNFRFKAKEREDVQSENMAYSLHFYPPSEVLGAPELLYEEWNTDLNIKIDTLLDDYLVGSNMRLHLTCPDAELPVSFLSGDPLMEEESATHNGARVRAQNEEDDADEHTALDDSMARLSVGGGVVGSGEWEVDKWFGTRYKVCDIAARIVRNAGDWFSHLTEKCPCHERADETSKDTSNIIRQMSLPPPNKYMSEDCALVAAPLTPVCGYGPNKYMSEDCGLGAASLTIPTQILDTPTIKGWHLLDVSMEAPRAAIYLSLNSAQVDTSARSAALLRMLLELLELRINEQRYMAEEAGITIDITNYSFSAPCYGLRLLLNGFSGKLPQLLEDVVEQLESLSITEELFAMAKEKAETDYRNRKFQQPYLHSILSNHRVLETPFWSDDQRLAELQKLTPTDLALFHSDFLSHLQIEALVCGNIESGRAKMLLLDLQNSINMGKLKDPLPPQTIAQLPGPASHTVHVQLSKDADHFDSAVSVYLQIGQQTHKLDAHLQLLCQMLDKEAYSQLRTREQLGYIVAAEVSSRWGVSGLRVAVQSARAPHDVHSRVEAFLVTFRETLFEMEDATFQSYVDSLITKKLEKDRTLQVRASRLFHEIVSHTNCWQRRELQVEELRNTTKDMLLELYDAFIMPAAPQRRKLTSFVVGKAALEKGAFASLSPHDAASLVSRSGKCAAMSLEEARAPEAEEWLGNECVVGEPGETVSLDHFVSTLQRYPALR